MAVATGVATGVLKSLAEKLVKALGDEYKRFKGVRGEIESIVLELEAMHAFLVKLSGDENPDEQDKAWSKEVQELSYDMEDSLDEFMLRVDGKSVNPHSLLDKCKNFTTKLKTRQKVAKEIEKLKKQIKEAGERNQRYKNPGTVNNTSNTSVDPRALTMFEDASKLVGIDRPKAELIKLLAIDEKSALSKKTKVVSIVGSGGLGKTTLASQVYQELKGQFNCAAFLFVSRTPDMTKILRTILSEVTKQPYINTEAGGDDQLIWKIRANLQDKRYLIVIDDVWKEESWKIINSALFKNSKHSRIVTTTRVRGVAEACCSSDVDIVHQMKPLSLANSKMLFLERLFGSVSDCPAHLVDISDKILKKCDGLPLAVISISGLLANKNSKHEWDQVHSSIGRGLEKDPLAEKMRQILSLSYFDLPHHLKACLLYLSVFPEDSVIARWRLVRRWIAEGFIKKEGGKKLQELGERCFTELINRSLIQPQKVNMCEEVTACQVHDTILDFIVQKSEEENFVTLFGDDNQMHSSGSKVRRLSLHASSQEKVSKQTELDLSHVRSVTVFDYTMELPLWSKFRFLRVLDLQGCTQVKSHHLANVGEFFQLKYLSLHETGVCELPEQIGKLQYLESLELRKSKITTLPASVAQLPRLVYLAVDDGVKLPDEAGSMTALEDLGCVGISMQSVDFILELGQMKNLGKVSLFLSSSDSSDADEFKVADILVLGHLPALVYLEVLSHESYYPTRPMTIRGSYGFLRLKQFVYRCNVPVMFEDGAMPELEKLSLKFSFFSLRIDQLLISNGPFGIQHLSCLKTVSSVVHYKKKSVLDWIGKKIVQMENKGFSLGKKMADMICTLVFATCYLLEAMLRQDPSTGATTNTEVHNRPKFPKLKLANGPNNRWSNHDTEEIFPFYAMFFIRKHLSKVLRCETPVVLGIKDKELFSTIIIKCLEDTSEKISLRLIQDIAYPATIYYLKQDFPEMFEEEVAPTGMNQDDVHGMMNVPWSHFIHRRLRFLQLQKRMSEMLESSSNPRKATL